MQYQTGKRRNTYMHAGILPENESWEEQEKSLYIAKETPGSARDRMRDYRGIAGMESPEPLLRDERGRHVPAPQKEIGPLDVLIREYRRDKVGAALCAVLLVLMLAFGALWIQKTAQIKEDMAAIERLRSSTAYLQAQNEAYEARLEQARNGERIRNMAQNNLGMLRPERADVQEIYIQMPEDTGIDEAETVEETKVELLDIVLNILNRLHIGR